jgi:hypothetical protein
MRLQRMPVDSARVPRALRVDNGSGNGNDRLLFAPLVLRDSLSGISNARRISLPVCLFPSRAFPAIAALVCRLSNAA